MTYKANKSVLLPVFFLFFTPVLSETRLEIKKDVITGNSELPKVMYIIPWQSTVTKSKFKGVELENYYLKLLQPFHPHSIHTHPKIPESPY